MKFIPIIGLEIHAELLSKTKIFCSCENKFGEKPNTLVCPVCTGMPGTLPVLNKKAVELAIKAGLILDCQINNYSSFDRKNYFYPDLPKAYQITQFYHPICENGHIKINNKKFVIERIHLEEDAGKLLHDKDISIIDYNRCGVPLIEIVTAPDFRSLDEVCDFVQEISLRLKYADVCDAKLEEGSLRVDLNISVMEENQNAFGTRAEIKNLNSLKSIKHAIEYETERQISLIQNSKKVLLETRRFDENTGKTISMRAKETKGDYRYLPEPDLPEIFISDIEIENIGNKIPTMPNERFLKYINEYKLTPNEAHLIIEDKLLSDFYDASVSYYASYKTICNIILNEINRYINKNGRNFNDINISPINIAETAKLYDEKKITKRALSEIIDTMMKTGDNPKKIVESLNLLLKDNSINIENIVKAVLSDNSQAVKEYSQGNKKAFTYLMGQVMRNLGKGANPETVIKVLENQLKNILAL